MTTAHAGRPCDVRILTPSARVGVLNGNRMTIADIVGIAEGPAAISVSSEGLQRCSQGSEPAGACTIADDETTGAAVGMAGKTPRSTEERAALPVTH